LQKQQHPEWGCSRRMIWWCSSTCTTHRPPMRESSLRLRCRLSYLRSYQKWVYSVLVAT